MTNKNNFVSEETIEKTMADLEANPSAFDDHIQNFEEEQPALYNWLLSENFDILTTEEKDQLLYLAIVIKKSITITGIESDLVNAEEIEVADETNWEKFLAAKGGFREKLNGFFEGYNQEDLLALVEDALEVEEDEKQITTIGREILFISLKTLIDLLCKFQD